MLLDVRLDVIDPVAVLVVELVLLAVEVPVEVLDDVPDNVDLLLAEFVRLALEDNVLVRLGRGDLVAIELLVDDRVAVPVNVGIAAIAAKFLTSGGFQTS